MPDFAAVLFLELYLKESKSADPRDICTPNSQVITSSLRWPSTDDWMKKMCYTHNWILFSHKEEWTHVTCGKISRAGDHYIKWNKPGPRRQLSHAFSSVQTLCLQRQGNKREVIWEEEGDQRYGGRVQMRAIRIQSRHIIYVYENITVKSISLYANQNLNLPTFATCFFLLGPISWLSSYTDGGQFG